MPRSKHSVKTNFVSNPLDYLTTPPTRKLNLTGQLELRQKLVLERQKYALKGMNDPLRGLHWHSNNGDTPMPD